MSEEILHIPSIARLHQLMGLEPPKHPLISIVDMSRHQMDKTWVGTKMSNNLYSIMLKDYPCGVLYGKNHFDFDNGVLIFTAPNQVIQVTEPPDMEANWDEKSWMLFFHPDLIRGFPLGERIHQHTFFSYEAHEALHLSDSEKQDLFGCIQTIRNEYGERIDNHSSRIIVSTLELLLSYCSRFYERQFNTRTAQNQDVVSQMEKILIDYYDSGKIEEEGAPSIKYCAEQVHLSPSYLSDLLKKETGRTAKDHINDFLVDKAKTLLLGSNDSVSEIAYALGFNYPHYFSRLFKTKTGMTPLKYRGMASA
ncbi:helix-turn-helix transcriptional regulator [Pontibacter sp. G13]|uniref:helix-turn-helix domain-containing protein n=1 Tax=Pontibacter sp. G13 TaxID=3074898 RepID=UPI00288B96B8|nr:helix-turn-helix transcriptional regulator [Pontibacter sp. G13]WNJ18779.1 helix-turn-helix transcriptional regulator [Pontibacter sp. G13]